MQVQKALAVFCVVPLALAFLWFAGKLALDSVHVRGQWQRVEAAVADISQRETITLEMTLDGKLVRQDVRRDTGFGSPAQGQQMPLYVNTANHAELCQDSFADLWLNSVILGAFGLVLGGIAAFMLVADDGSSQMARRRGEFEAAQKAAADPANARKAPPADDGKPIEVREPRQSWKANVFWGLLFGLPAVVLPLLPVADVPTWQKAGYVLLGVAWMALMGFMAVRNYGRTVRVDMKEIIVSTPFDSERIALAQVTRVVRTDVRQQIRDFESVGRPSQKTAPFSTMAPIILYILYDAEGRSLLRLDRDMEPAGEMGRLLRRLEAVSGQPIGDA
jgi:hypothetical protein